MDSTPSTQPAPGASAPGEALLDLSGKTVGEYQVLRKLGQGGMGQVYLAEQQSLRRKVALKILKPELARDETALKRFEAEAMAVARITHANIVQVYAFNQHEGLWYMALEYVEGRNLRDLVARKGPPELLTALSIMRQVAAALQRASEAGIIHRDIKPENILITRKWEVKVADFGLSRVLQGEQPALNLTQSGVTMGTPLYMSPEQVEGKPLDHRADLYSFGVTCYHMLAGVPPFRGTTAFEVALKHVREEPPPLAEVRPDLPAELCALVHKMMAKDPAQRHQTARELFKDLGRLREGLNGHTSQVPLSLGTSSDSLALSGSGVTSKVAPSSTGIAVPPRKRRGLIWLVVLSLLLAGGAGAAVGWWRQKDRRIGEDEERPTAEAVEVMPLQERERYERSLAFDHYLNPAKQFPEPKKGPSRCADLINVYLSQHRLEEADELCLRMEGVPRTDPRLERYRVFGKMGRAIVVALRDKDARGSNEMFRDLQSKGADRPADAEDYSAILADARRAFAPWLAEAVYHNFENGVPQKDMPQYLRQYLKATVRKQPPDGKKE